ncbi:MAG: polyhydroxyalkanoate depolymerase [Burkholderiaceae bacterium]|nr:polyhydroxyalkanoate depolymerase [Burkholderiaceae bacterium]
MLYTAFEQHAHAMWPLRAWARAAVPVLGNGHGTRAQRHMTAALETMRLAEITHRRPAWGIERVREHEVVEEAVLATPFATLTRFAKRGAPAQPRVLLVAPMSGHFATLLRDTVRTMLADHDVHVTDWHSAREIPLAAGRFGLEEYTEHLMRFLRAMGPGSHVVAICQPCVAALAATALMSEDDDPAVPASLTLMAGPIDCRISPTAVNQLATSKSIDWFEHNLISCVPLPLKGAGRRVYPGFVQVGAFMSMNRQRHVDAFRNYYVGLVEADHEATEPIRRFYEEYLAVADLPAEFYLETVKLVFQDYALPRGELRWRGRTIDASAIRRTALVTIEGERDDICAPGQTLAAQDLCSKLRPYMRTHAVQAGVGHYGVFSGRRWQQSIYPMLRDVIHVSQ